MMRSTYRLAEMHASIDLDRRQKVLRLELFHRVATFPFCEFLCAVLGLLCLISCYYSPILFMWRSYLVTVSNQYQNFNYLSIRKKLRKSLIWDGIKKANYFFAVIKKVVFRSLKSCNQWRAGTNLCKARNDSSLKI